jgi:hypothetical protein
MKVSFDGLRQNIASDFNALIEEVRDLDIDYEDQRSNLRELGNNLRASISCLLSCYDKDQQPDDFNDLSGLELEEL